MPKVSGSKIREARHARGLTQAELARVVGTRERNIIRWENDQHAPRLANVLAIAQATGRDIDFFITTPEANGDSEDDEESDLAAELVALIRRVVQDEIRSVH